MSRVIACAAIAISLLPLGLPAGAAAGTVELHFDNALELDGRPWTVERAAVKIGGDGAWHAFVLRPGAANAVTVDVETAAPRPLRAAVVELGLPDGGRLLGSVPVADDGRIELQGALFSGAPPQPAQALQGASVIPVQMRSGAVRAQLQRTAMQGGYSWPAHCAQMTTVAGLHLFSCAVDVGRPHKLMLQLYGVETFIVSPGGFYWATMRSSIAPETWVSLSQNCATGPFCPTFHGWVTPLYVSFTLAEPTGPSGELSGWGVGSIPVYASGHLRASFAVTPAQAPGISRS